ncbi:hypothetical protein Tco_0189572 [Tanacetum coccineum]
MNEDYYHEQNSCYDHNSFGFDQVQPPQYTVNHPIFNSQNELLNSQNKLMEQMTTLRELVDQAIQKKEEEKRIAEEQAAKDRSWKIPICYDDDEDNTIAITPVLPIEEPDNSLSMGDEHLDTIPATESDEVIKSSVEDLVPIPKCLSILDYDDNLRVMTDSTFGLMNDILLTIKDDILREKLLNVNLLLIAKIDSLRDNPTPSSEVVIKSTSTFPNLFLEETNIFDNSIPESETFRFNLEEIVVAGMYLIRVYFHAMQCSTPHHLNEKSMMIFYLPVLPPFLDHGILGRVMLVTRLTKNKGGLRGWQPIAYPGFPECEDSRAFISIHEFPLTPQLLIWESSIQNLMD